MKAILSLSLLIACPSLALSVPGQHGIGLATRLTSFDVPQCGMPLRGTDETTRHRLHLFRGGAYDVGVFAANVSIMAAFSNGILNAFFPSLWEKLETAPDDKLPGPRFFRQITGVVSIGEAVTIYTSLILKLPANQVIGLSLLPRVLGSLWGLGTQAFQKVNVNTRFLLVNSIIMSWVTISNLFKIGNYDLSAKTFVTMAVAKSLLVLISPVAAADKFLGVNLRDNQVTKKQCFILGQYLMCTVFHLCSLAYDINPITAAKNTVAVGLGLIGLGLLFRDM